MLQRYNPEAFFVFLLIISSRQTTHPLQKVPSYKKTNRNISYHSLLLFYL